MWTRDYCCHLLVINNGWSTAHFETNGDCKRQKTVGWGANRSSIIWEAAKPVTKAHFRLTDASRASRLGNDVKCTWYLSTNTFFYLSILITYSDSCNESLHNTKWMRSGPLEMNIGATTFITIIIITFQTDTFTASTK